MILPIANATTAEDITKLAETLYGSRLTDSGLLHPTAVWQTPESALITLKINEDTPKSSVDFFVLNLTRARADAILTTGAILRSEPDLRHELQGPAAALARWRREVLAKDRLPVSLVLTSGRQIDLDHPFFNTGRALIFTSLEGQRRLVEGARERKIEVIGTPRPSLRRALSYLEKHFDVRTVSNEAGPSASLELYEEPGLVKELLLSRLITRGVPESTRGSVFLGPEVIEKRFERRSTFREQTDDGDWLFERWTLAHTDGRRGDV